MAFPASVTAGYTKFVEIAAELKAVSILNRDNMAAEPISASGVLSYLGFLQNARAAMLEVAAIPGIGAAYPTLIADANAVISATTATAQWIATNLPKSNGYMLLQEIDTTTTEITWRVLSVNDTAGLRTQMDSLIATID